MNLLQKKMLLLALALSCGANLFADRLLPAPREVEWQRGSLDVAGLRWENPKSNWATIGGGLLAKTLPHTAAERPSGVLCFRPLVGAVSPEAYELRVTPDSVVLSAAHPVGVLRGAQTLSQLLEKGKLPCCVIKDAPAYAWRGAMLDVSRHFFPLDFVKKQIDVLSSYKINRLHLHLTDAAGWRMEIKRYPRLTSFAAWRPEKSWKTWWNGNRLYAEEGSEGAYGGYYTQKELRGLVKYAAERGITIVPEIEMPAHSEEVLTAYPELSCTHEPYKQADFCPGSVATYDFLENVLKEVMDVFPSEYIHVGGDEAAKASWPTCPLCQKKMKEMGFEHVDDLQTHLIAHMGRFLRNHGRRLVGWDEVIAPGLEKNSTVMVWRSAEYARSAAELGYDVVMAPGSNCYLDFYQDAPPTQPEAIGGYTTLEKVYGFNPLEGLPANLHPRVKGVQGNLWTEYVPTEEHVEYMLYPRMLALAEIGWNGTAEKNFKEFRARALKQTNLLRSSGVAAFDLAAEKGERIERSRPVKHKALNAKVNYNVAYSDKYAAGGAVALTDGLRGGWANNDGRWQGFIGKGGLDVTIDLGSTKRIRRVATNFMQACGPEIFYPSSYVVSVSTDGKNFTEVGRKERASEKTINPDVELWQWQGSAKARYVRVQAAPSTFGGWLFADEIEVY